MAVETCAEAVEKRSAGWVAETGGCTSAEKRMYLVDAQPAVVKIPKKAPGEKLLLKEIVKQNKNGCRKLTEG